MKTELLTLNSIGYFAERFNQVTVKHLNY